jgi:hypothetical protein
LLRASGGADFGALLKALHCLHNQWPLLHVIACTNSFIHPFVPPLGAVPLRALLPAAGAASAAAAAGHDGSGDAPREGTPPPPAWEGVGSGAGRGGASAGGGGGSGRRRDSRFSREAAFDDLGQALGRQPASGSLRMPSSNEIRAARSSARKSSGRIYIHNNNRDSDKFQINKPAN